MNIGYSRVSTTDQGNSAEAQEKRIRAWAEMKGIEIDEVVVDLGEFSGDLDRPGITRVLEMVRAGKVSSVIVTKLDRISRSVSDVLDLVKLFNKMDVSFVSVEESIDTKTPIGQFFVTIVAAFAQMELSMISARTSAGLQHIKSQGYSAGNAPYGWSLVKRPDEEKKARKKAGLHTELVENPVEQAIMARVEAMRAGNWTLRQIADCLTADGLKSRRGGEFSEPDIHRILKRAKVARRAA